MSDQHQQTFFGLRAAIKAESYTKALAIATELAKELPDDEDVIKCKCVCMVHLSRYEDALAVASNAGATLAFEGAYCLYQMNRLEECLVAIEKASTSASTNLKALKAQVLYRLNRASESADVYQGLVDEDDGDGHEESLEGSELLSNTLAAYAAAGRGGEGYETLSSRTGEFLEEGADADEDDDEGKSYEIAYNAACALLDGGRYAEAAELLQVAEERCKRQGAFTTEATGAAVQAPEGGGAEGGGAEGGGSGGAGSLTEEGAVITCQRAVGLLKASGGSGAGAAHAMALCAGVMKHGKQQQQQSSSSSSRSGGGGADLAVVVAVATNTLAVARKDRELFDSHKRLRAAASVEGVEAKLTVSQAHALNLNKCLLLLHMGKLEECEAAAKTMLTGASVGFKVGPALVLLSLKLKLGASGGGGGPQSSLRDASKLLVAEVLKECEVLAEEALKGGSPRAAAEAELFGCQLLLLRGDVRGACGLLEGCKSPLLKGEGGGQPPAVAATVADMKERFLNDHDGALKTLDSALLSRDLKKEKGSSSSSRWRLVMAVAQRKVALGEHAEAALLLEKELASLSGETGGLATSAEERLASMAQLVLAYSWCDPDKADDLLAKGALPPPEALSGGQADDDEDGDEEEGVLDPLVLEEAPLPKTASSKVRRLMVVDKKQAKKLALVAAAALAAEQTAAESAEGGGSGEGAAAGAAAAAAAPVGVKNRAHEKRAAKQVAKLVAAGKLASRNPAGPDPLRWVPKKLRTGKGRKALANQKGGAGKISGAQGVSTEGSKDAAKLDAYARAQAKKDADAEAKAAAEAESSSGSAAKRGPWRRMK